MTPGKARGRPTKARTLPRLGDGSATAFDSVSAPATDGDGSTTTPRTTTETRPSLAELLRDSALSPGLDLRAALFYVLAVNELIDWSPAELVPRREQVAGLTRRVRFGGDTDGGALRYGKYHATPAP